MEQAEMVIYKGTFDARCVAIRKLISAEPNCMINTKLSKERLRLLPQYNSWCSAVFSISSGENACDFRTLKLPRSVGS